MAWTSTLTELISDVRTQGNYENSRVFTDAVITRFLNKGIAKVHQWKAMEKLDIDVTSTSLSTSAGSSTVALPSDFWALVRLDLQVTGGSDPEYTRIHRFAYDEENGVREVLNLHANARGYFYRRRGSNLVLVPQPNVVDTLRLLYIPHATELVNSGDTYDGINGLDELVVEYALLFCDKREKHPTQERLREIERLKAELRPLLTLTDVGEADYLADNGGVAW